MSRPNMSAQFQTRPYPRRVPSNLSVSVIHGTPAAGSKNKEESMTSAPRQTDRNGVILPVRHLSKDSEDSEDSSSTNAQKWFNDSNKRPGNGIHDNEPPFFQKQSSSSSNSSELAGLNRRLQNIQHPNLVRSTTNNGSGSDDYRSVIDDLTIENRRLKEKLRKYEVSQNARLEKDRLFEVKVHGLPARKKRELEETLRAFASSIDGFTETSSKRSRAKMSGSTTGSKNPSSSSTSNSRPINSDSAYASMSQSGPGSGENKTNSLGLEGSSNDQQRVTNEKNVESFLHTMAPGLMPKHSSVMTEKQKKREVVRRLEQLFTGKTDGIIGDHSQPLQQQEVSRSAARADQAAKTGPKSDEGIREAQILKGQVEGSHAGHQSTKEDQVTTNNTFERQESNLSTAAAADPQSPEQRPTRPLDLDPDRQQVPADNVEYIRHLGLSTPQLTTETTSDVESDADGWIYLNLLIGMAQLHIINVTPDFVRSAVAEVSEKFQLSRDGRKIRWRGGSEGTRLSSGSSESDDARIDSSADSDSLEEQSRKRRKTNMVTSHKLSSSSSANDQHVATGLGRSGVVQYKPLGLFRHQSSSEEDLTSLGSDWQASGAGRTPGPVIIKGKSSCSGSSRKRRRDDGPIVFYSGANFCVDLSGDKGSILTPQHIVNHTRAPIGYKGQHSEYLARSACGSFLSRPPFKDYSVGSDFLQSAADRPKTPDLLNGEDTIDFDFSPGWATERSVAPAPELQDFAATGLGCTQPADHFAIRVKTKRVRLSSPTRVGIATSSAARPPSFKVRHTIRPSALELFQLSLSGSAQDAITSRNRTPYSYGLYDQQELPVKTEIIATSAVNHLRPSLLPEPTFLMASSSSEDEWEAESTQSSIGIDHLRRNGRLLSPSVISDQGRPLGYGDVTMGDQEDDDDDDDDMESEGSIDMLAHAREADPDTIAAQEEEFETQAQRRLLDELPAGSSAATIDGGSGFSSEECTVGSGSEASF
ncbi:hypothetical protein PVAG01_03084 [Phlyctema vagabunda]|uniref:Frequency clock protein n=1 Tax=Phlyctema vagabunda TaxID=108571 RepID=A0ABR4PSX8_9HELO